MDISTSFFFDDFNYLSRFTCFNELDRALLYETYGMFFYNLGSYARALRMFKCCCKEYKLRGEMFLVLKNKFQLKKSIISWRRIINSKNSKLL